MADEPQRLPKVDEEDAAQFTEATAFAEFPTSEFPATEAPFVAPVSHEEPIVEKSGMWVLPDGWLPVVGWEGGLELGINGTEGNSQAFSNTIGANLKLKNELHEIATTFAYVKSTADGIETANNALLNVGYERVLHDSPWTFFAKYGMEYDEFKAFDLRVWINSGLGYQWIKTEQTELKSRFGAGASREIGGPETAWVPEATFGGDFSHQLTERQKLTATVDYFPEWTDFTNFRVITDVGWEILLDESHNLNLKFALNDRYDSTPNGRRPNDVNYSVLLLWKM